MTDLAKRIGTSSLFLLVIALIFTFAFHSWFRFVVAGLISLLGAVGIWEYGQLALSKGRNVVLPVLVVSGFLAIFTFFLGEKFPLPFFFLLLVLFFALHFRAKEGAILDLATSFFGLIYIAVPLGMLLSIFYQTGIDGRYWVFYLFAVTKITDTAAYFGGHLFGKRKLAPMISPSKTMEGALFGFLFAVLTSFLLSFWGDNPHWLLLGCILGIMGQFGDLAESLLKRDAQKKDSNSLPGLGGVLDSIDSLLLNIPIIFIYLGMR